MNMTINEEYTIPDILELDGRECATGNRHYETMSVTPVAIAVEQGILAGSITSVRIEVGEVDVKEFEDDTAFPSGGFSVSFD